MTSYMFLNEDIIQVIFLHLQPKHLYSFICACKTTNQEFKRIEEKYISKIFVVELFLDSLVHSGNHVDVIMVQSKNPKYWTEQVSLPNPLSMKKILQTIISLKVLNENYALTAFVRPKTISKNIEVLYKTSSVIAYYDQWFKERGLNSYGTFSQKMACYIPCKKHPFKYCNNCPMSNRFHIQ
jgi:hypothetical protein